MALHWYAERVSCGYTTHYINVGHVGGRVMRIVCKLGDLIDARELDNKTLATQAKVGRKTVTDYCRSSQKKFSEATIVKLYEFFELKKLSDLIEIDLT